MTRQIIEKYYNGVKCFYCDTEHIYKLNDGRIKCGGCHKRYSLARLRNELSAAHYFSLEINCRKAARDLDLNYKTVYKIYKQIRSLISDYREEESAEYLTIKESSGFTYESGRHFTYVITERDGKIFSLIKTNTDPLKLYNHFSKKRLKFIIYDADEFVSYRSINFYNKFNPNELLVKNRSVDGLDGFWNYAKERLQQYHGVDKKYIEKYLREIEFRYNNRNEDLYTKILSLYYNKSFGSENTQFHKSKN